MILKELSTNLITKLFTFAFLLAAPLAAHAIPSGFTETETAPINELRVSDDGMMLEGTVFYKNGCYEPWAELKSVGDNVLIVAHMAKVRESFCVFGIEYENVAFSLKTVPNGSYLIRDAHDGKAIGTLTIDSETTDLKRI